MVILENGASFEMQWQRIKFQNHGDFIIFEIIPMMKNGDLVLIPKAEHWECLSDIFSFKEMEQIISSMLNISWARKIRAVQMDRECPVNEEPFITVGTLEASREYLKLSRQNLFDPDSGLNEKQARRMYFSLEKQYAKECKGEVPVPYEQIIGGSVMEKFVLKPLEKKKDILLRYI